MSIPTAQPDRPMWAKDIQALAAIVLLAIAMAGGWTALNGRVTKNESDIAAQAKRLDREIVVQSDRVKRIEDYLVRIESKIDRINQEPQRTSFQQASSQTPQEGNHP